MQVLFSLSTVGVCTSHTMHKGMVWLTDTIAVASYVCYFSDQEAHSLLVLYAYQPSM